MPEQYWVVTTERLREATWLTTPSKVMAELNQAAMRVPRRLWNPVILTPSTTEDGLDCYIDLGNEDEMVIREATTEDLQDLARKRIARDAALPQVHEQIFADLQDDNEHLAWIIEAPTQEILDWVRAR